MEHYVGIDVSLESASVCVVEAGGRIVREAKVASESDALIAWIDKLAVEVSRIELEAGPLSQWLYGGHAGGGGFRWSCWRPGTCVTHSRPCR